MAEDFIEEIYRYSNIISELKTISQNAMKGKSSYYFNGFNDIFVELCKLSTDFIREGCAWGEEFSDALVLISEHYDDIRYIADVCMIYIVPGLEKWVQSLGKIEVEVDDYVIESSSTGYLTIKSKFTNRFLHSVYDPMQEAKEYVEYVFDPKFSNYVVYGCGLGYHLYQLYKISRGSVKIYVYESDITMVNFAYNYGVLSWIPEENLEVISNSDILPFLKHVDEENVGVMMLSKSIHELRNTEDKEILLSVFVQYNTIHSQRENCIINFHRNLEMNLPDANTLVNPVKTEAVIVAGGPTVDDGLELLRKWKGKKTIIAVMTIFRKLIENGIKPDYVVAIDPSEEMEKHLFGVENEDVPAILDLNVYWKWTHYYHGPKYMTYSAGAVPEMEDYIIKNHKERWPSGGTVTYQAIEFAIRNNAKKIYLMGTDMGYPGGESHSGGTAQYEIKQDDGLFQVPGVYGVSVKTDRILNGYREDIEKRIDEIGHQIEFYNLSTAGARIKGTKEVGRELIPDYLIRNIYRNVRVISKRKDLGIDKILELVKEEEKSLSDDQRNNLILLIAEQNIKSVQEELNMLSLFYQATKNDIYFDSLKKVFEKGNLSNSEATGQKIDI